MNILYINIYIHLTGGLLIVSEVNPFPSWREGWWQAGMALEQ